MRFTGSEFRFRIGIVSRSPFTVRVTLAGLGDTQQRQPTKEELTLNESSTVKGTYKRGERVKHGTKPEWGLGEVLNDQTGDHVQVIFEDAGLKTFKVGIASFVKVSGEESKSDYLSALVKRHLHPKGKVKSWTDGASVPFTLVVEGFLRHFPGGFQDPEYSAQEREYKQKAHVFAVDQLDREEMQKLLGSGHYAEVCNRSRMLMNRTNLISPYEKLWLRNGLDTPGRQQLFAQSLNVLLYGEESDQVRFEAFVRALHDLQALKWPIATYFLFMRFPDRHIFVKPEVTKHIANILHVDIEYTPEVTWLTYSRMLHLAQVLTSKLTAYSSEVLAPRDMIDVQSFIWVVGAYDS